MATLKIKYPTMISSILETHHQQYSELRQDIVNLADNYNNKANDEKLRIPFRGKSKSKVINHINYDLCNIGQRPSIIICVEEYREGFEDLYLKKGRNPEVEIKTNDKISSVKNYALMYPIIEQANNNWTNRWVIVIYDTPNKDDSDIINTIKYTVNKIFLLPFKYALPTALAGQNMIPKVEVTFVNLRNEDNDHLAVQDKVVKATTKTTHSVLYANVTTEEAQQIVSDNGVVRDGLKRIVKMFKDPNNRAATDTITQELDDDGNIQSTFISKYGYSQDIEPNDLPTLNTPETMVENFSNVITNYLTNGAV